MPPGTYDVVVTNPDGETGRLPQAFVVQPCLAYAVSWSSTYDCEYDYEPLADHRESSQLSTGGTAQIEYGGGGTKTVTSRHLSGVYIVTGSGSGQCATDPDCGICTWSRQITADVFETPESLSTYESLEAYEADGMLTLSGLHRIAPVANYHYVEHGSGSAVCDIPPTNTDSSFVALLGGVDCGVPVENLALSPLGDGRTYTFSQSQTVPDLYGSCVRTCSLQGVRISP
jgi:hypothetical protein